MPLTGQTRSYYLVGGLSPLDVDHACERETQDHGDDQCDLPLRICGVNRAAEEELDECHEVEENRKGGSEESDLATSHCSALLGMCGNQPI